jgi:general secretion pathway protein E
MLCERCKAQQQLSETNLAADPRYEACGVSAGEMIWVPRGCERCSGTGYRGRVGVFEALEVAGEVRDLVGSSIDASALRKAARREGVTTMMEDAIDKCRRGLTSVSEALRVTTAQ